MQGIQCCLFCFHPTPSLTFMVSCYPSLPQPANAVWDLQQRALTMLGHRQKDSVAKQLQEKLFPSPFNKPHPLLNHIPFLALNNYWSHLFPVRQSCRSNSFHSKQANKTFWNQDCNRSLHWKALFDPCLRAEMPSNVKELFLTRKT